MSLRSIILLLYFIIAFGMAAHGMMIPRMYRVPGTSWEMSLASENNEAENSASGLWLPIKSEQLNCHVKQPEDGLDISILVQESGNIVPDRGWFDIVRWNREIAYHFLGNPALNVRMGIIAYSDVIHAQYPLTSSFSNYKLYNSILDQNCLDKSCRPVNSFFTPNNLPLAIKTAMETHFNTSLPDNKDQNARKVLIYVGSIRTKIASSEVNKLCPSIDTSLVDASSAVFSIEIGARTPTKRRPREGSTAAQECAEEWIGKAREAGVEVFIVQTGETRGKAEKWSREYVVEKEENIIYLKYSVMIHDSEKMLELFGQISCDDRERYAVNHEHIECRCKCREDLNLLELQSNSSCYKEIRQRMEDKKIFDTGVIIDKFNKMP